VGLELGVAPNSPAPADAQFGTLPCLVDPVAKDFVLNNHNPRHKTQG
jgi:hypothetical protein